MNLAKPERSGVLSKRLYGSHDCQLFRYKGPSTSSSSAILKLPNFFVSSERFLIVVKINVVPFDLSKRYLKLKSPVHISIASSAVEKDAFSALGILRFINSLLLLKLDIRLLHMGLQHFHKTFQNTHIIRLYRIYWPVLLHCYSFNSF